MKIFGRELTFHKTPPVKKELIKEENPLEQGIKDLVEVLKEQTKPKIKTLYTPSTKNLIVVYGEDILQGNVEEDVIEKVKQANSKEEIEQLLASQRQDVKYGEVESENTEEQEKQIVYNYLDIFEGNEDFEVVNGEVFFKGIRSVAIPNIIVANFIDILKELSYPDLFNNSEKQEEYNSLKMFTLKLLLNPLENSRNQLLIFVRNNNVHITTHGNLVLYRACKEKDENNKLIKFIAKEYLKLKAWKKSPKNYWVNKISDNYVLVQEKHHPFNLDNCEGNLSELYLKLPELQKGNKQFYSYHGSKKIVIGDVYKIDDNEVDLNADVCSAGGLHVASVDYDYSSFGSVNLVCLVNPSKTITVPTSDFGKMRVSEMMIVGINDKPIGEHISEDFVHDLDDSYHNYSIEELENALKTKSLGAISVSDAVAEVSLKEVKTITEKLRERIVMVN